MENGFLEKIKSLAEDVVAREGCLLYDVEFISGHRGQGRTLRIYIEKSGEEGVGLSDCANVSRGLNLILDVEDAVPGEHYILEVSSPGMDRVLRLPWHFQKALGQKVQVKTLRSITETHRQLQISGVLKSSTDKDLTVETREGMAYVIPFDNLNKAKVIPNFEV